MLLLNMHFLTYYYLSVLKLAGTTLLWLAHLGFPNALAALLAADSPAPPSFFLSPPKALTAFCAATAFLRASLALGAPSTFGGARSTLVSSLKSSVPGE